jgi:hypothetical protein
MAWGSDAAQQLPSQGDVVTVAGHYYSGRDILQRFRVTASLSSDDSAGVRGVRLTPIPWEALSPVERGEGS